MGEGAVMITPGGLAMWYAGIGRDLLHAAQHADPIAALTRISVTAIPGTEQASISEGRPGQRFRTLHSTGVMASTGDQIQYELNSGPCVDAMLEDTVFCTGELTADRRWPAFGTRAHAEAGALSMLSLRLFLEDDERIAGLNLYSSKPGAFDEAAQTIATVVATHTALALLAATARERAGNLQHALTSNRRIGMAMGVLMAAHELTEGDAFALLRIASQGRNRKVADVAEDVLATGALELPDNKPGRQQRSRLWPGT